MSNKKNTQEEGFLLSKARRSGGKNIMAQMEQANKIRYNQFSQKDLEEMLNKMADLSIDWEAGKTKRHPKRKLPWQE